MRVAGSPRASHIEENRLSSVRGTATSTRPADSENRKMNGSAHHCGKHYAATGFTGQRRFGDGLDQPAFAQVMGGRDEPVARGRGEHLGQQLLAGQVDRRR